MEQLGVDCPTTSIEEYIKGEDFSSIMSEALHRKSCFKATL